MTNPNSVITVSTLAQFRTRLEQILQKLSVNINGLTANTVERALAELLTKVLNTYTQSEVNSLLNNLTRLRLATANELPTASVETLNYVYLVPNTRQGAKNVKNEYITIEKRYTKGGDLEIILYYLNYRGIALGTWDNPDTYNPSIGDMLIHTNEIPIDADGNAREDAIEIWEEQTPEETMWSGYSAKLGDYVLIDGVEYVFYQVRPGYAKWDIINTFDDSPDVRNVWYKYDWELLGTTEVDLSNYVTNNSLLSTLSDYKRKQTSVNVGWREEDVGDYYAIAAYTQNENGEVDITAENIPVASTSAKGLMSATDKTKLNAIESRITSLATSLCEVLNDNFMKNSINGSIAIEQDSRGITLGFTFLNEAIAEPDPGPEVEESTEPIVEN